MIEPLPELSTAELETLLAALDPLLDGFGEGAPASTMPAPSWNGWASARAMGETTSPLLQWLESWRAAGGNRTTLRLMVQTLLTGRQEDLPD